MAVPTAKITWK